MRIALRQQRLHVQIHVQSHFLAQTRVLAPTHTDSHARALSTAMLGCECGCERSIAGRILRIADGAKVLRKLLRRLATVLCCPLAHAFGVRDFSCHFQSQRCEELSL